MNRLSCYSYTVKIKSRQSVQLPIAVLNLMIDKAPTNPRERTILDLMVITIKIETPNNGKILAIIVL